MIAGLPIKIAEILGWPTRDVASIRVKYVDHRRVAIEIANASPRANGKNHRTKKLLND
jgi:hypothetical protein